MKAEKLISGNLLLRMENSDRIELKSLLENNPDDDFDTDVVMFDFMEEFIGNTEYQWVSPESIGALTSAPILGTVDKNGTVIEAYGFMDYAIISLQRQLLEHGQAVLIKG